MILACVSLDFFVRLLTPFLGVLGGAVAALWLESLRTKRLLRAEVNRIIFFVDNSRDVEIDEFWRLNSERLEEFVFRVYVSSKADQAKKILEAWKNLTEMDLNNAYAVESFGLKVINDVHGKGTLLSRHDLIICSLRTLEAQLKA
ncbi:MAG: hypothetical protein Q7Q71_00720 [Verrucomicrobiota bacterium JB023]|nr:hypothetical protein [Verrucomicrobiota bacterium JB023]